MRKRSHAVEPRVWTAQGPPDLLTDAFDAPAVIRMPAHRRKHQ